MLAAIELTMTDRLVAGVIIAITGLLMLAVLARVPLMYNVRNLAVRFWTTLLTALAFTLVVALLTVMLAFVNGMYRLTENSGHPENIVILGQGTQDEVFSTLGFGDADELETLKGLLRDEQGRPAVSKATYVIVNQPVPHPRPNSPKRRFLQVRGVEVPEISGLVHRVKLNGAWFSPAGVQPHPSGDPEKVTLVQAVIGEGLARTLGGDRSPEELAVAKNKTQLEVGDEFVLGARSCIVVGVMQSRGQTFDSEVWAKRELVGKTFGKDAYSTLVLRATDAATAKKLEHYLKNDYGKGSLQPMLETTYFNSLNGTNKQFLVAIIAVAIVMAVGGVFGVMNTMFAAISQRTKDIGVMRLIGFGRVQILCSFLLESLVIALLGGGLGCLIGSVADGWSANSNMGSGQGGGKSVVLELVVDWKIIAQGMLFSLVMGAVGGFIPAVSAMRLKLLDTLR